MRNYYFYIIDNKRVLSEVYEGQVKSYNALNTTKILEKEINMGISNIKILEDNITVTFSNNVRITFEDKAIEKVADNYEALIK